LSTQFKKRIVLAILIVLLLWAPVHRWLVHTYDIDPWHLFGWAMYCRPDLGLEIRMVPLRGEHPEPQQFSTSIRRKQLDYGLRRMAYGSLVSPEDLARFVLSELDGYDGIAIRIEKRFLDPASARIHAHHDIFRYRQSGGELTGGHTLRTLVAE